MPDIENLKLLSAGVKRLVKQGYRISMPCYFEMDRDEDGSLIHWCGTAGCLAGLGTLVPELNAKGYHSEIGEHGIVPEIVYRQYRRTTAAHRFFALTQKQFTAVFSADIPDDQALANLDAHIAKWEQEAATHAADQD